MDKPESRRSFVSYTEEKPVEKKEALPDRQVQKSVSENVDIALDGRLKDALDLREEGLSITAPKYTSVQKGSLKVSWALIDDDYYYQIELLKKTEYGEKDIATLLVMAFEMVIPKEGVKMHLQTPPEDLEWPLYTVIAQGAGRLFGAKQYMEQKVIEKIIQLELWP